MALAFPMSDPSTVQDSNSAKLFTTHFHTIPWANNAEILDGLPVRVLREPAGDKAVMGSVPMLNDLFETHAQEPKTRPKIGALTLPEYRDKWAYVGVTESHAVAVDMYGRPKTGPATQPITWGVVTKGTTEVRQYFASHVSRGTYLLEVVKPRPPLGRVQTNARGEFVGARSLEEARRHILQITPTTSEASSYVERQMEEAGIFELDPASTVFFERPRGKRQRTIIVESDGGKLGDGQWGTVVRQGESDDLPDVIPFLANYAEVDIIGVALDDMTGLGEAALEAAWRSTAALTQSGVPLINVYTNAALKMDAFVPGKAARG